MKKHCVELCLDCSAFRVVYSFAVTRREIVMLYTDAVPLMPANAIGFPYFD
jgi:hypothetical protein